MRVARKRSTPPPALGRKPKKRHKRVHALVEPKFEVLADGAHAVTIPVHTRNHSNIQQPNSKIAGILRSKEREKQRKTFAGYLFGIGVSFRSVTLVRLAPSAGLDTGGLWNALKAVQDEIAAHLCIDDGPDSPASWEVDQERAKAYGVRVELRMERRPDVKELRAAVERVLRLCEKYDGPRVLYANEIRAAIRGAA